MSTEIEQRINKILDVSHSKTRTFRELMLYMLLKYVGEDNESVTVERAVNKEKRKAIFIVTIDDYF